MAKPARALKSDEVEVVVTAMRKIGPERFDVVTGVLRGPLEEVKVLEKNVTLMVGRMTARASIDRQANSRKAALGISADS